MLKKDSIKRYIRQIFAFIEKSLYLEFRIRTQFFSRFLTPLIELFLFIILFGAIFKARPGYKIGYWDSSNFVLFLLIAFCIQFTKPVIMEYKRLFINEKYWKTISAIMVAPVNRFTLLVSVLISELVVVGIPFSILFVIALILYPIPLFIIFLILLIFLAIFLIFGALGLIIAVFSISNEEYIAYLTIILRFTFLFSCTNIPLEIFPKSLHFIILINPFYYIFDLLRLTWYSGIEYEVSMRYITPTHIIILIVFTIISPIIAVYLFNKVYKKYGIVGY
ncbi:MAG: ABC transporter permease [Promethearchaeota archaeon]